jgi:hypothetical protein
LRWDSDITDRVDVCIPKTAARRMSTPGGSKAPVKCWQELPPNVTFLFKTIGPERQVFLVNAGATAVHRFLLTTENQLMEQRSCCGSSCIPQKWAIPYGQIPSFRFTGLPSHQNQNEGNGPIPESKRDVFLRICSHPFTFLDRLRIGLFLDIDRKTEAHSFI